MLYVFLIINVLVIGALVVLAVQHGLAHFRPEEHDAEHHAAMPQNGHLSPAVRQQLMEAAQKNFEAVLHHAANELQTDLSSTADDITKQVQKLSADTVGKELELYRARLAELTKETEDIVNGVHQEVAGHQEDMKAKLAEQMDVEKQRLVQQMDTKLADAVASFLTETLQHNIDLGAQTAYLTSMLEEHKAELIKGVTE